MTIWQALILGIVQGITEFLPISSSGHLVLVPWLLGWDFEAHAEFVFDVLVQWGTLIAVVSYFWKDGLELSRALVQSLARKRPFQDPSVRLAWLIIIASVPAVIFGLLLKTLVANTFDNPQAVSTFLLGTAVLLFISDRVGQQDRILPSLRERDAVWIGFSQVLALFPGVSRSGATITGGMTRGLRRDDAARFSFLMSVPVMIGAGLIAILDLIKDPSTLDQIGPLLAGFFSAGVVGYLSIHWLLSYLSRRSLTVFIVYCTFAGLLGWAWYAFQA